MKSLVCIAAVAALIGTRALAADVALKAPPAPAPMLSWTGFYAGLNGGYGWGSGSGVVNFADPNIPFALANASKAALQSVLGGLQAGYNWQASPQSVFGIEADAQDFHKTASQTFSGTCGGLCSPNVDIVNITSNRQISWFGTVRGRIGYTANNLLFYGTAGLAFGEVKQSGTINESTILGGGGWNLTTPYGASKDRTGWTAGVGTEAMLSSSWSWKIEYLYVDLGSATASAALPPIPGISISAQSRFTANVLRMGLNLRLN